MEGQGEVLAVTFRPDGHTLLAGYARGSVSTFSTDGGQSRQSPLGVAVGVQCMRFSLNGEKVAIGTSEGTLLLWSLVEGQQLCPPLRGHQASIRDVTFASDDSLVASAGKIVLWDVKRCAARGRPLVERTEFVSAVAFSPDGKTLASGSCFGRGDFACDSGEIRFWDVPKQIPKGPPVRTHSNWVSAVAFSADGRIFASAGQDGEIQLRSAAEPSGPYAQLRMHNGRVNLLAFRADGGMLGSAGFDGRVLLWTPPQGRACSSRLTWAVADGGRVRVERIAENGAFVVSYRGRERALPNETWTAAVVPDGRLLAIEELTGGVSLLDIEDNKVLSTLSGAAGSIESLAFSGDGRWLAGGVCPKDADSTCATGDIVFWDVGSGPPLGRLVRAFPSRVTALAFLPDSDILVSAGCTVKEMPGPDPCDKPGIRFWNIQTGAAVGGQLQVPNPGEVASLAVNAAGTILASRQCRKWEENQGCLLSEVWLWDLPSRTSLGPPADPRALRADTPI